MATQIHSVAFRYSHTIGRSEYGGTGFRSPVALAVRGERIYVVSRSYEYRPDGTRVTICTVKEEYLGQFGMGVSVEEATQGIAPDGALVWPRSIALDHTGNVYVVDEWLNRVSIFTEDGRFISKWGRSGQGDGEMERPSGLAFDQDENLYVVDSWNNRVQKFTKEGTFLAKWGRAGSGDGEFNMPWGIHVDREGYVYVADWRNDRIQKLDSDGRFLSKFGSPGKGDGQLRRPTSVSVDKDGMVYVTDWDNDRLEVFESSGSYVTQLTGDGALSQWGTEKVDASPRMWHERAAAPGLEREKLFWRPIGVVVDEAERVLVLESARHRIQVYHKLPPMFLGMHL